MNNVNLSSEIKVPLDGQQSSKEWVGESTLRKVDSTLYNSRTIILISACILPSVVIVSKAVASVALICFFALGILAIASFTCLDGWNQAINLRIKEAKAQNIDVPAKNPKITLGMNIANKIIASAFPFCIGSGGAVQLIPLTSTPVGVIFGIGSAALVAGVFYAVNVFGRDYTNQDLDIEPPKQEIELPKQDGEPPKQVAE